MKIARLLRGKEPATIGLLIGVHRSNVWRWQKGLGLPKPEILPSLALAVSVPLADLEAALVADKAARRRRK